ncbi:efflux RND transporter permease subunit [Desulfosporosinus lacus]|uniref:Heavy metal efflux pump, CzcA family/hydrophobe/amphiphile efflux-1 (HAE1) family protein n=1 Tax=Desulfosporosinus lacus DSM 15449 TaxID=1121420 RepID=A0A1M6F825_9FIRM|nr:efflux RND transporter permease subunit [Desulfosporosinus lacus]SHI93867.1 heavy metal efflux pump, CzcA family/hydrophobe/amphiphile efflux-1 (HAE1) family protein [Desulfosporosinus lacus DSM 15449]
MILADVSIKRPVFITVIFVVLLVVGILSYDRLTVNDMPQADIPYVTVTVEQRGASPEQLETKVTKLVEEAAGQISGVKHISSTITEGVSNTVLEFSMDKSADVAVQEVRDKVGSIRGQLPQEVEEPVIAKFDMSAEAIFSLAVSGTGETEELSQLVNDVVKKGLYTVKGVGAVNIQGNTEREIHILLDKEKLASFGLTTSEVVNSLQSDNLEMQGGKVTDASTEISLSTTSNINKVEDFNNILIAKRAGSEIRVRDIAEVTDGMKDRESLCFYQGKPAIGIDIIKQSGANTVEVSENVKEELARIAGLLPEGVKVDIVRDNSQAVKDTVNNVNKTVLEGCILAVAIIFLFLNKWQSTLTSAISLPISIITTFIAMKLMNFSINTMSMMAISLSVGLLIDDAIVVIENIERHLGMGKSPFQAAQDATSEIGLAVLATSLSVVAVFLPVALVSGFIGKIFIEFGLTVVFSMLVSLFVSFTLVPMMSAKLLKAEDKREKGIIGKFLGWFNQRFDKLAGNYSQLLKVVLRHRLKTLVLVFAMFAGSIALVPGLGFTFLPATDLGELTIDVGLDSGLSLKAAGQKAKNLESIALKYPEVRSMYTTVGKDQVSIFVKLSDKKERKDSTREIAEKMRNDYEKVPGIELAIYTASMGSGTAKDVTFNIRGNDYEQMQTIALAAKQMLREDPSARDVSISYKAGKPKLQLDVDRDQAADLGVNPAAVGETLNTLFDGVAVSKFNGAKDRYDVRVSLEDDQRVDLGSLSGIYVSGSNERMVALDQVTRKVFATTSSTLQRYDRTGQIELSANVTGISTDDFSASNLQKLNHELQMPKGISLVLADDPMGDGFIELVIALGMGILFIFLVMAAQFESFIDPVAIMFALPLAIIGAILGLFIAGSQLSVMSLIGVILLMGLVAKNAILLVDYARQRRSEGAEINKALVEAGLVRLRPIVMTSLAMIFGMLPSAFTKATGSEMYAPMAHAVIGGLITSTILTLFVVPVIYTLLDDCKKMFQRESSAIVVKG